MAYLVIGEQHRFFSEVALTSNVAGKHKQFLPAIQQDKTKLDSFAFSDYALRLNVGLQKSSAIDRTKQLDSLSSAGKNVDEAIKRAVGILTRIKDLTVLAQDDTLSDRDRVEMQIEIADLESNLKAVPSNLLTGKALEYTHMNSNNSDPSTMLERMRERIINGEEWNVREAYAPEGFARLLCDDNGEEFWEVGEAGWYAVDDRKVWNQDRATGAIVESSKSVPTVRDRLNAYTDYVVMDSKSASKSTAVIDDKIHALQNWSDKLPETLTRTANEDDLRTEASLFLESVISPGGADDFLALPDTPRYFIGRDGERLYDTVHLYMYAGERPAYGTAIQLPNECKESDYNTLIANLAALSKNNLLGAEYVTESKSEPVQMGNVPPGARVVIVNGLR